TVVDHPLPNFQLSKDTSQVGWESTKIPIFDRNHHSSTMDQFPSSSSSAKDPNWPHVFCLLCNQRIYKRHLLCHIKMEHFFGYKPYHCRVSWCLDKFPTWETYELHRTIKHPQEARLSTFEIPDLEALCESIYQKNLSIDSSSKIDLSKIDFDRFYRLIFSISTLEKNSPKYKVDDNPISAMENLNSKISNGVSTPVNIEKSSTSSSQNTNLVVESKLFCKLCKAEYSKNSRRKHVLIHLKDKIKFLYSCLLCNPKDPNLCRTLYIDTIVGHVMKKHAIKRNMLKIDVHYKSLYKKYANQIEEMIVKCFK
uniref:C2H2-type domain-containing protein n=1 Tax=Romanomermis culicivorax TaxID=13658 RepID=A0A915ICN4_ROMCU